MPRSCGSFIPEQTQVTPWSYAVHRDPNNFSPIPEQFWPDRWLVDEYYTLPSGETIPADQVVTTREVFMPFSLGPFICAGKPLAIIQLRAAMCAMVQQCDVRVADGFELESWDRNLREVFATSRGKLDVVISSNAVGVFTIEVFNHTLGITNRMAAQDIKMEDLLQAQFEDRASLSMFNGIAKFNLNLLLWQINKKQVHLSAL